MPITIALAGNPNSGKTTLFNQLTGSTAHVGNWPGVTVERREGTCKKTGTDVSIVDLPGIYSLSPYSPEEVISGDYVLSKDPDVVIDIIDATNLERNLYLTTQILEMDKPVVIALNMIDVIKKMGVNIEIKAIEKILGVPVVPIAAINGYGVLDLINKAVKLAGETRSGTTLLENNKILAAAEKISEILRREGATHPVYNALKLIGGETIKKRLSISALGFEAIKRIISSLEGQMGDLESAVVDGRYKFISKLCEQTAERAKKLGEENASDKIDNILTNKVLGIPMFFLIMFLIFHLTFTKNLFFVTGIPGPGAFLEGFVSGAVRAAQNVAKIFLTNIGTSDWAIGLLVDGIFGGVGAVLGFSPLVLILYLFISILEDSGYMARAAFIMDRITRRFGLSGKAFVPLIMGFGCSVPAVSATRVLENESDRRLAITLIPFMSCGAKIPIYALIAPIFFREKADLVITGIYALGIFVAIIGGALLKNVLFRGETAPFIMELPQYRAPSLKSLSVHLWEKLKGFAEKVGVVITAATIVIWFLSNFGTPPGGGFGFVEPNGDRSILAFIGNTLKFIFVPLGFANGVNGWKAVVSVLSGLVAREAVVSTMGQLYTPALGDALLSKTAKAALASFIGASFSVPAALSFISWNLLSVPCMAAVGAISAELKSPKRFWGTIGFLLATAWIVSFIVFRAANLFF